MSANYVLNEELSEVVSLKIKDVEKTETLLKLMSDSVFTNGDFKHYKLNPKLAQVFSFSKDDLKMHYAFLSESHLLFFSNQAILNFYQESFSSSKLLGKNLAFMEYANDNLMLDCNYLYYENSALMKKHNISTFINSEEFWKSQEATEQLSLTAKKFKNSI